MNWVAVNIQTADADHRISNPEYVHVWIKPGQWFNMPQVPKPPPRFCSRERPPLHSCPASQAAISLEEDGTNIVSSTMADELLGAPFASMAPRDTGAHVGRYSGCDWRAAAAVVVAALSAALCVFCREACVFDCCAPVCALH